LLFRYSQSFLMTWGRDTRSPFLVPMILARAGEMSRGNWIPTPGLEPFFGRPKPVLGASVSDILTATWF
jgi:hypothetical protein